MADTHKTGLFSYDFNAPRFHDFSGAPSPAVSGVDAWFERQPQGGPGVTSAVKVKPTVVEHMQSSSAEAVDPLADQENKPASPAPEAKSTNIVTGWGTAQGQKTLVVSEQKRAEGVIIGAQAKRHLDQISQEARSQETGSGTLKRSYSWDANNATERCQAGRPAKKKRHAAPEGLQPVCKGEAGAKWHSMAEQMAAFEKKARSSPRLAAAAQAAQQLTSPQSPHLATLQRQRPTRFKSHDEEEAAFMAEVQEKNRAHSSGSKGAPGLATSKRARAPSQALDPVPEEHCFRAQPVNPHILEAPTFVPKPSERPLTVAHAPELCTESRARPDRAVHSREEPEVPHFHARPAPASTGHPPLLKEASQRPLTLPKPFDLASQPRHEQAREQHRLMVQQDEAAACAATTFHAQEAPPDLDPWQPQPCDKALTLAIPPRLALETRSAARARFDAQQAEKTRQMEERKKAAEAERAALEAAEVAELRKTMVFKATKAPQQRVRAKKKGVVARQTLTLPRSPQLATRARKAALR